MVAPASRVETLILRWPSGLAEVHVIGRRGQTLVVRVADATARPALRTLVTLDDGRARQPGRVAGIHTDGALVIAMAGRAVRTHPRMRVNVDGLCAVDTDGVGWRPMTVLDLSRSGVRIQGLSLPVRTRVQLHFVAPHINRLIRCRAEVVRQCADGSLALAFCLFTLPEHLFPEARPSAVSH
jgi:hypothetical protein